MGRSKKENDFRMRVDNTMISLICDYHNVHHAEVLAFFGDLVSECLTEIKPNISNADVKLTTLFKKKGKPIFKKEKRTDLSEHYNIWVVRGFYPNSKVPFKMVVSEFIDINGYYSKNNKHAKITLGDLNKTDIDSSDIHTMNELLAESELLDAPIDDSKIEYKLKSFRTMTPKGLKKLKKKA